jgi:hypothetical protein
MFKLSKDQIKPLVRKMGGCFATNMITMEGKKVNFMYRETPKKDMPDSGWRFFSGHENDDYINDPNNTQIYEVNTIANYDPDIIPFLESPYNSVFERNRDTGEFEQVFDFPLSRG